MNFDEISNIMDLKKSDDSSKNKMSLREEDKMAIRTNFVRGFETYDSSGFKYDEWDGIFKEITEREMTDAEFMDFCDWWDNKGDYEKGFKIKAQKGESIIDWMLINPIIEKDPREEMGLIKKR